MRSECGDLDRYVTIKHTSSGLFVDGSQIETITIEKSTNSDFQQWKLSPSKTFGLFNIINKANG